MTKANEHQEIIPSQDSGVEEKSIFPEDESGFIVLPVEGAEQEESAPPVIETPKDFKHSAKQDLDLLEERIQKLEKRIVYSSNDKRELDKQIEELNRLPKKDGSLDINYNPFTEQSAK